MSPLRLRQVSGDEGRVNDTLFQPAAARGAQGTETLVFFGGDVQDYPEIMAAHRDNRNYLKWNLESTARMLGINFPNKHILVVRPSRIEYKSFSCYDNFVSSNEAGVPEHAPSPRALPHLHRDVDPLWWNESLALHEGSLSLVGFSKGCVVLNQVVFEFHYAQTLTHGCEYWTSPLASSLARRVRELYWLDGGHAGAKGAWLTQRPLLDTLAGSGVQIYIHVSPYQIEDESRPWIGREEKIFTSLLKKLGAKVERYSHAAEGPASLHTHFALLGSFKRLQDSALAPEH